LGLVIVASNWPLLTAGRYLEVIVRTGLTVQSNLVITNFMGPGQFVCYNWGSLYAGNRKLYIFWKFISKTKIILLFYLLRIASPIGTKNFNYSKPYMIPVVCVGGGGGCLSLTHTPLPPEKIQSLDPPQIFFLAKNGKICPKNSIFLKIFGQPLRFSQICCKISWKTHF
jgi:hypothetical protein